MKQEVKTANNTPELENFEGIKTVMNSDEHDWEPDGESWTKYTCSHEKNADPFSAIIRPKCSENCRVRKRRYTCHCGKSKTVRLKNSGDKQ